MKDYARTLYSSTAWKKCRAAYTRSVGGLCERCRAKGLIVPGVIVHHKIYISPDNVGDPTVTGSFKSATQYAAIVNYALTALGKELGLFMFDHTAPGVPTNAFWADFVLPRACRSTP